MQFSSRTAPHPVHVEVPEDSSLSMSVDLHSLQTSSCCLGLDFLNGREGMEEEEEEEEEDDEDEDAEGIPIPIMIRACCGCEMWAVCTKNG